MLLLVQWLISYLIVKIKELEEVFMNKTKAKNQYEGCVFSTKSYGDVVVVEYLNSTNIKVKFINTGNTEIVRATNLKRGLIKDHHTPFVLGVGVVGNSKTISKDGCVLKEYVTWTSMLSRCYSSSNLARFPTYKDCSVSENFKYYPYFKEWYSSQIGHNQEGWHLDKDILVEGNKVYSEDTCVFVPPEINVMLAKTSQNKDAGNYIGVRAVKGSRKFSARITLNGKERHLGCFDTPEEAFYSYKEAKESYIKEVANKWKDQIDPRVYEALMKYEVMCGKVFAALFPKGEDNKDDSNRE